MSAESNATSHALAFGWWRGCPDLTDEEARLHDLFGYYDSDGELGISSDP